jgi:hypothetical protein
MADFGTKLAGLKARFLAEVKRDRKRAALMVVLGGVLVVVLVRLVASAPAGAQAAVPPAASRVDDKRLAQTVARVDAAMATVAKSGAVRKGSVSITRDLFAPDPSVFPLAVQVEDIVGATTAPAADADAMQRMERQARQSAIESEAKGLELVAVMFSGSPSVILNGNVLRVGDAISGFKVLGITPQQCVVEKDGVRLTLSKRKD